MPSSAGQHVLSLPDRLASPLRQPRLADSAGQKLREGVHEAGQFSHETPMLFPVVEHDRHTFLFFSPVRVIQPSNDTSHSKYATVVFFLMMRRPPISKLVPYSTLFFFFLKSTPLNSTPSFTSYTSSA